MLASFEINHVDFKILSLNVRGLRSPTKRKALLSSFGWISEGMILFSFKKLIVHLTSRTYGGHNGRVSFIFHMVPITVAE